MFPKKSRWPILDGLRVRVQLWSGTQGIQRSSSHRPTLQGIGLPSQQRSGITPQPVSHIPSKQPRLEAPHCHLSDEPVSSQHEPPSRPQGSTHWLSMQLTPSSQCDESTHATQLLVSGSQCRPSPQLSSVHPASLPASKTSGFASRGPASAGPESDPLTSLEGAS